MDNLNIDDQGDAVEQQLTDPNIAAAIGLTPQEVAIQAKARQLGQTPVVANTGALSTDAGNLGDLASIYQAQLAAGPGLRSQAANLQAERNTNSVGGLRSLAAGAQGEQNVAAVGQAEANQNAAGAIGYGNNAALAQLQNIQTQLQAHFDNLSNHNQGTQLSNQIALASNDRNNALFAMQNNAAYQAGQASLSNSTDLTKYAQQFAGAGVNAAASGITTGMDAYYAKSNKALADPDTSGDVHQGSQDLASSISDQYNTPTALASVAPTGGYDNVFGVSGAPDADTWALSSAASSFGLQSNYQSGVA